LIALICSIILLIIFRRREEKKIPETIGPNKVTTKDILKKVNTIGELFGTGHNDKFMRNLSEKYTKLVTNNYEILFRSDYNQSDLDNYYNELENIEKEYNEHKNNY
jgi:hypothetical protein